MLKRKAKLLFLTTGILLLALTGCMTTTVSLEEQEKLQRIVELPGHSKTEIYNDSIEWFARSYNSANNVVQLKDPEVGKIIGRGSGYIDFGLGTGGYYSYTIIVDIQEERMRIRYENINSDSMNMDYWWKNISENLELHTESLINSVSAKEADDIW